MLFAGSTPDDQSSAAGQTASEHDQTVSSPLHPSAGPHPPLPTPSHPPSHDPSHPPTHTSAAATAAGHKAKLKGKIAPTAGTTAAVAGKSQPPQNGHMQPADSTEDDAGQGPRADGGEPHSSHGGQGQDDKGSSKQPPALTPAAVAKKPTRCHKCYTCLHKQLKKQCLRNKVKLQRNMQLSGACAVLPGLVVVF